MSKFSTFPWGDYPGFYKDLFAVALSYAPPGTDSHKEACLTANVASMDEVLDVLFHFVRDNMPMAPGVSLEDIDDADYIDSDNDDLPHKATVKPAF